MSTPTPLELERDAAMDDEAGLQRALRIVRAFYEVYGEHETTARYIDELSDILIAVKQRARARHQKAERNRLCNAAERQDAAKRELEQQDAAELARLAQFL